jgi:hypothetical protein
MTPTNLVAEKARFFNDPAYDPVFTYQEDFDRQVLTKWGQPQPQFVTYALSQLKKKGDLKPQRHPLQNQVVETACRELLTQIGVTEPIEVIFQKDKATRCSISGLQIIFQDQPQFESDEALASTLNHEVQTHLLRNLNQKKQGWKLDRIHFDHLLLRTEEGLAVLHSMLGNDQETLWRPCAYYVAVDLGQKLGFRAMFNRLQELGFDNEWAWKLCVRAKRGIVDASQPGGNTKDLCYLEGAVQMWQWLNDDQNQPSDMYLGKIYIEELEAKKQQLTTTDVYLPLFMKDQNQYRHHIQQIGDYNQFQEIL